VNIESKGQRGSLINLKKYISFVLLDCSFVVLCYYSFTLKRGFTDAFTDPYSL
jgi:hypothetical protein